MKRIWSQIDRGEKSTFDFSNWIAVLPLGATEQHGPHLPFETDSLIAQGIVDRLVQVIQDDFPVTFLPVETIGYSPEHLDYPGSKSLSYQAAIENWIGKVSLLHDFGIRKILLLNAHGGNSPLMTIVTTELRIRFSMLAVATSWTRFGTPNGLVDEDERAYGIHGGDMETSVMLALHENLVRRNQMAVFPSAQQKLADKYKYLRAYGKHAFGWKMQDLSPIGVVGDATKSSAKKGELLLAHSVNGIKTLIEEMAQFDLNDLDRADQMNETGKTGKE